MDLDADESRESQSSGSTTEPGSVASRTQDNQQRSIKRCIQSLVHACQCQDSSCAMNSCTKMKRVVQHFKTCKRKSNGNCPICKQLLLLCCYHSKHCTVQNCVVLLCSTIKQKRQQHQMQQRRTLQMMMKRRMQTMRMIADASHAALAADKASGASSSVGSAQQVVTGGSHTGLTPGPAGMVHSPPPDGKVTVRNQQVNYSGPLGSPIASQVPGSLFTSGQLASPSAPMAPSVSQQAGQFPLSGAQVPSGAFSGTPGQMMPTQSTNAQPSSSPVLTSSMMGGTGGASIGTLEGQMSGQVGVQSAAHQQNVLQWPSGPYDLGEISGALPNVTAGMGQLH